MQFLFIFAVMVAIFLVIVSMQPSDFKVTRSATMAAPAAKVFEQVNDLHKWQAWSPWARLDPNAKNTFEGPASGVGAVLRWQGNNKVGQGSMTITDSRPAALVSFRLDFLKPFIATHTAEFTFQPSGNQTTVTWNMSGSNNKLMAKAMRLIMNCDKMIGGQFEQGLANLKSVVNG